MANDGILSCSNLPDTSNNLKNSIDSDVNDNGPPSKKLKLTTSAEHIYKTMFEEGRGSDLTISMLGKEWRLHKFVLSKSPYFASMFSGRWKESKENMIEINVVDPNITLEGAQIALGSFYTDLINLEAKNVIAVLGAAMLFQLDSLIEKCTETMERLMGIDNVMSYNSVAITYGISSVKKTALDWLKANVFSYSFVTKKAKTVGSDVEYEKYEALLKQISPELMVTLITSPKTIPLHSEFSLYNKLKIWLFVHCASSKNVTFKEFFMEQKRPVTQFLNRKQGQKFLPAFEALRIKYILWDSNHAQRLFRDNIIPRYWLHEINRKDVLLPMLQMTSSDYKGPVDITEDEFQDVCYRCCRIIENSNNSTVVTILSCGVKINFYVEPKKLQVAWKVTLEKGFRVIQNEYNIALKVIVRNLDEQRQVRHVQRSNFLKQRLFPEQKIHVMTFEENFPYPRYMTIKLLVHIP